MWLIMRDAAVMLGMGVVIGLPVLGILGRLIESQLFGVRPVDWPTIAVAALVVAIATFVASALPVGKAIAISPIAALRHE